MPSQTPAQAAEYFHLAFLQVLPTRLDRSLYVLKGGANLRYFFESERYSEDIDLDAWGIESWKLTEKVDDVLSGQVLGQLLRTGGLALEAAGPSKQTDTTQRWKPAIGIAGRESPVRTRIEFSHRSTDPRKLLEAVPPEIVKPYALRAPSLLHYSAGAAIDQKIEALALRSETQARDVFDLDLLLRRHADAFDPTRLSSEIRETAAERSIELPFEAFRDQVLPFLNPDSADLIDEATWERMSDSVASLVLPE